MARHAVPVQFNHVGFTVDAETLRGDNLERLRSFFEEVFGFTERAQYTREGEVLIMMAGGVDQFVIFFAHDTPSTGNPHTDHFGMRVETRAELDELFRRALDFRDRWGGVELSDLETRGFDDVVSYDLHRFYVRCGTPFSLEAQYYEFHPGEGEPTSAEVAAPA
jgi:hypothetical protein